MKPIYKKISQLGLITVFHAGFDYGFPPPYGATPEKLLKVLSWFQSPVIAAHWGGINCNHGVLDLLCGKDIYFIAVCDFEIIDNTGGEGEYIMYTEGTDRLYENKIINNRNCY